MERYWVFIWELYESRGGMNDFRADFKTVEEAFGFIEGNPGLGSESQVLDSYTFDILEKGLIRENVHKKLGLVKG